MSEDLREAGRLLFAKGFHFTKGVSSLASLPPIEGVEIAFAGRSNVGKSSLINALTGRSSLARASHTPGRTQQLNYFKANSAPFSIIDMPGYGYAAVSKEKVAAWQKLVKAYLRGRANLARVYVLIDGRHGLKSTDEEILHMLDESAVSYQILLTKADALSREEQEAVMEKTLAGLKNRPASFPEIILTSSRAEYGIEDLRTAIALLLKQNGL